MSEKAEEKPLCDHECEGGTDKACSTLDRLSGFRCTRSPGHKGYHIACATDNAGRTHHAVVVWV